MVSRSLVSSVWVPKIRTRGPKSHPDWSPILKYVQDVATDGPTWLSAEFVSQLGQRLISVRDIFKEARSLPSAGSLRGAFLPVLILPHQTAILWAINFPIIYWICRHTSFSFLSVFPLCSYFLIWCTYTHLKRRNLWLPDSYLCCGCSRWNYVSWSEGYGHFITIIIIVIIFMAISRPLVSSREWNAGWGRQSKGLFYNET